MVFSYCLYGAAHDRVLISLVYSTFPFFFYLTPSPLSETVNLFSQSSYFPKKKILLVLIYPHICEGVNIKKLSTSSTLD